MLVTSLWEELNKIIFWRGSSVSGWLSQDIANPGYIIHSVASRVMPLQAQTHMYYKKKKTKRDRRGSLVLGVEWSWEVHSGQVLNCMTESLKGLKQGAWGRTVCSSQQPPSPTFINQRRLTSYIGPVSTWTAWDSIPWHSYPHEEHSHFQEHCF